MASQPSRANIAAGFREYQLDRKEIRVARKNAAAAMTADNMPQIDPANIEKVVNTLRVQYMPAADA